MTRISTTPRRVRLLALLLLVLPACARSHERVAAGDGGRRNADARAAPASDAELGLDEVAAFRAARDFFALRDRLGEAGATTAMPALVARAAVAHAFNRPEASNAAIRAALAHPALPDTLDLQLREMAAGNHVRRHRYASALEEVDALLLRHEPRADSAALADVRNLRKILTALADVPPQRMAADGPSIVVLERGRIPVAIGDSARHYVFDTGANLSTIMRSEAEALGLDVRPAGLDVGTSTDLRITADVGVARSLRIGRMEFRDVVFLVVDDAALTFGEFRIPGIIGFPVIEAMGEIRLRPAGELEVPAIPPARPVQNLALIGFTPITPVLWRGNRLICRLDTGAGTTDFYEPFFRRFRGVLEPLGTATTRRSGGVGGVRELPVLEVPALELALGDTTVVLDTALILTRRIVRTDEENYLDCNIGHDILDAFTEHVINFRDMSFLLR